MSLTCKHHSLTRLPRILCNICCPAPRRTLALRPRHELPDDPTHQTGPSVHSTFPTPPDINRLDCLVKPLRSTSPKPLKYTVQQCLGRLFVLWPPPRNERGRRTLDTADRRLLYASRGRAQRYVFEYAQGTAPATAAPRKSALAREIDKTCNLCQSAIPGEAITTLDAHKSIVCREDPTAANLLKPTIAREASAACDSQPYTE